MSTAACYRICVLKTSKQSKNGKVNKPKLSMLFKNPEGIFLQIQTVVYLFIL